MAALEKTGERKRGRITLRVDVVVAKSRRKSRVNQAEGGKIRHKSWPRFFPRPAFTLDGVGHRLDLSASGSQEWILHIDHGRPSVRFEYVRIHSKLAGAPQRMQGKKGGGRVVICAEWPGLRIHRVELLSFVNLSPLSGPKLIRV